MIPIKIQCLCGQNYAFEADPAEAFLAGGVQCPVCGADGTEPARAQIARFSRSTASRNIGLTSNPPPEIACPALPPPVPRARPQRSRKEPRAARRWLVLGILSGVLLAGVLWATMAASQGQKRATAFSAARFDNGFPHTPAEVQAWYAEPPTGQNGAPFYQKGLDALRMPDHAPAQIPVLGNAEIPPPNSSVPQAMRSEISALLRSNQVALDSFKQGAMFVDNRYAVDLSSGSDTLFMHVELLKRASVLLELAALSSHFGLVDKA